jgi:hypothetical protein
VARPEGFEPPTFWFVAKYSIQLSYGRVLFFGGERGIRTLDGILSHTPLAGERLRPLGHLSIRWNWIIAGKACRSMLYFKKIKKKYFSNQKKSNLALRFQIAFFEVYISKRFYANIVNFLDD